MSDDVLYDWRKRQRLDDWKLEGYGELFREADGAFHVRTFNHGPMRQATNVWLYDLDLPEAYEVT